MRILLFALFLLIFLVQPCRATESLLLVTNEYAPYVNEDEERPGFMSEVMLAAFREVGVRVHIQYRPWRRCAMMVEEGRAFGAYPYGMTDKRLKYALFSDPVGECRNVFFYLRGRYGELDYTQLEDLQRFHIAGTSGHYYEEIFRANGLRVDYAPGEASGVRKIWEVRADMFAEDELVGWNLIHRIFPRCKHMFASTPTPWNINPQYLMVSRKYPGSAELLEKFNKGLQAIRQSGKYDRIYSRYFMK